MSPCVSCGTTDVAGGTLDLTIQSDPYGNDVPAIHAEAEVDICRECARRLAEGGILIGRVWLEDHP